MEKKRREHKKKYQHHVFVIDGNGYKVGAGLGIQKRSRTNGKWYYMPCRTERDRTHREGIVERIRACQAKLLEQLEPHVYYERYLLPVLTDLMRMNRLGEVDDWMNQHTNRINICCGHVQEAHDIIESLISGFMEDVSRRETERIHDVDRLHTEERLFLCD